MFLKIIKALALMNMIQRMDKISRNLMFNVNAYFITIYIKIWFVLMLTMNFNRFN